MDGQSVPRDYDEARRWFAKGAGKGEPYCALGMALHELQVHQASPDIQAVRRWLQQAADKNLRQAFFHLGRLYGALRYHTRSRHET